MLVAPFAPIRILTAHRVRVNPPCAVLFNKTGRPVRVDLLRPMPIVVGRSAKFYETIRACKSCTDSWPVQTSHRAPSRLRVVEEIFEGLMVPDFAGSRSILNKESCVRTRALAQRMSEQKN